MLKTFIVVIVLSALAQSHATLLRAEPKLAVSNDFSGQLEQVSTHGSPTDTLMSNQYFISKKHIPSPSSAKNQCDAFKCIEDIISFFRTSKKFREANCKPNPGHLQHYIDMDKDQEDASICRELYLLSACDTPNIHPTGVQCVRKGGPESANTYDLGCKCRLYGVGSKNKKLVGKASGKEVLLPGEIKKDGTVEKVDKKMMALYN